MGRKWRGTKKALDESESGEWKSWLKLNIQKMNLSPGVSLYVWNKAGTQSMLSNKPQAMESSSEWT